MWIAARWILTAWVVLRLAIAVERGVARARTHARNGVNIDTMDKMATESMPKLAARLLPMEKRVTKGSGMR